MKNLTTIITIIICTMATVCFSQESTEFVAKYKITAISAEDAEIESTSNTVELTPDIFLYVPNAFTPNEDGLNDSFGALGYGVKDYYMGVFNKWGELIFESEDINKQWNGTYQGQKVLPGTYIYSISASGNYEKEFHKEGSISIIKI
jgi:gliding motility-associated-like protein